MRETIRWCAGKPAALARKVICPVLQGHGSGWEKGGGVSQSTTGTQFRGEVQLLLQGGSEGVEFKNIRGGAAQEVGEFK